VLAYGGWAVGADGKGMHAYWPLPEAWEAAPIPARDLLAMQEGWRVYTKPIARVAVGCVFTIECEAEKPGTIFRGTHKVLGYLPDPIRVEWQAISQSAYDAKRIAGKVRAEKTRDLVREALEPVRLAYRRCRSEDQRRVLLVRVLRILQGG
jgi:hypothetical protein